MVVFLHGYGADEVYDYARTRGLSDRVEFLGHAGQAQLDQLYAKAAVLLFPSLEEGFGIPVLEAMSRGVPVVASNSSSLPEICGEAALLVNPLDIAGLADACNRILDDAALRDEMIARGLRQAAHFTWEKAARETVAVYKALVL